MCLRAHGISEAVQVNFLRKFSVTRRAIRCVPPLWRYISRECVSGANLAGGMKKESHQGVRWRAAWFWRRVASSWTVSSIISIFKLLTHEKPALCASMLRQLWRQLRSRYKLCRHSSPVDFNFNWAGSFSTKKIYS